MPKSEVLVGSVDSFPERSKVVVAIGEVEVGVFRVGDRFYGWYNYCAHRGGPVCQGKLFNHVIEPVDQDGKVRTLDYDPNRLNIVCPWHGYEFDVSTGLNVGDPKLRLKKANVRVSDGKVYVTA